MIGEKTVARLVRAVAQLGLGERLVVGGPTEQAYSVVPVGETEWRVSWTERGQLDQVRSFRSEHEAVCYLLGSIAFTQLHGGLLGTAPRPAP